MVFIGVIRLLEIRQNTDGRETSEQKEVSKGWLYAVKCLSNYVRRDKSLEEMTAGSAEERQRRNEGRGVEQGLTLDFNDDKLDLKGRQLALGLL